MAIRKIIALILATSMIINTFQFQKISTSKDEVSDIQDNGIYQIISAFNDKVITQIDFSAFFANAVVWNDKTSSDTSRFRLTQRERYYSMTNIISGKSMKICGSKSGDNCDFNDYDQSDLYKWSLEQITDGKYKGSYYISSAVKDERGNKLYAQITADQGSMDKDGAQINLNTKIDNEPRQIWKIVKSDPKDSTFTKTMRNTMRDAFKSRYYKHNEETGFDTLGGGFWGIAEVMEAMLDGYETTGILDYKTMFATTYNDFIARNGDFWKNNNFNDDITWASIMSVRAYMLIGDQRYLDIAVKNFNFMYDRASTFGKGLLRWCEEKGKDKTSNACINGPAIVCASYLGLATGDNTYWDKAHTVYMAQRNSKLYTIEGKEAGRVNDCIRQDGEIENDWVSTYNQGTYLGSAVMLYNHFGDSFYANDASNIAKYTIDHLCYNNILKEENTNEGDLSGFRGILPRYMRHFITDLQKNDYLKWFKDNSKIAWMNRNSDNLSQCSWQKKTSEIVNWDEFAGYNSISLMANIPTFSESIYKDAYSRIEAEDLDYCKGLISENSEKTSSGRSLGGITSGCMSAYYNVQFGNNGANKINVRYSRLPDGDYGTIEVRLDSQNGTLVGTVTLPNTKDWSDWANASANIARVTGTHNVYLIFKSEKGYVCNLDYLSFDSASVPINSTSSFKIIDS